MRLRTLLVLVFAFIAFGVSTAHAQTSPQVDKLRVAADDAMDNLRYAEALDGYQQAYAASHEPRFLYNMGRALGALGRYPEAVEKLERFRLDAPETLRARVPQLEQLIADFKRHVSTISIHANVAGARVLVRDKAVGAAPISELRVNSGSAVIEVSAEDYDTQKREVNLAEGGAQDFSFTLVKAGPTGIVVVRSTPGATSVLIDGASRGATPLEASLFPGSHMLVLTRDGYRKLSTSVVIDRGVRRELDLRLEKSPSIFTRWWFWTIVSAVVIGTGVTLGAVCVTTTTCERSADVGSIAPGKVRGP